MDIDRDAPIQASGSTTVAAPRESVWDVLADLESWPQWMPDVTAMSVGGPIREGTTFRWKAGSFTIVSTLEQVDRPVEIGWTGRMLGIAARHVWRFETRGGDTLVRTDESWRAWWLPLVRGRMQATLQRAIDAGLAALKSEAESLPNGRARR